MKPSITTFSTGSSGYLTNSGTILTARHALGVATRLRNSLAHETAHELLDLPLPVIFGINNSGMSSVFYVVKYLSGISVDEPISVRTTDLSPADAPFLRNQNAVDRLRSQSLNPMARRVEVFIRVARSALLRLLDGIITALCLVLMFALAALARLPHGLAFILVMLAACLRYGRRDEPADRILPVLTPKSVVIGEAAHLC